MSEQPLTSEEKIKQMEDKKQEMAEKKKVWEAELIKEGYLKEEDRPNPYNIPTKSLWNGLTLYGARLKNNNLFADKPPIARINDIRSVPIRDDDVIIAGYAKSGTHWLWEITSMLLNRSSSYEEKSKEFNMLELGDLDALSQEKSPRVLNTHLHIPHIPQEVLKKKTKIIHMVRNPKSVLVSFYFFTRRSGKTAYTMDSLMKTLIDNNLFEIENQLEYLRHMTAFRKANPDHPVFTIYYEEMKKNPMEKTKELAEFLGVPNTEEFYQKVSEACGFENMKQAEADKRTPEILSELVGKIQFYRKGTIGDWKNHLTVAQNEMMDAWIEAEFKKGGLDYEFTYE